MATTWSYTLHASDNITPSLLHPHSSLMTAALNVPAKLMQNIYFIASENITEYKSVEIVT